MIPKEIVKKLRKIEIHTARLANDQLAGSYHSVFKGRGMAFSEVRQYQHGDDVRFIDWNVSARMQDTYVKVFTEEREMTVMLLVDLSASERFGTQRAPKARVASEVAALLAFSAIRNNDRVGLILSTSKVERIVPPKKGEKHVMRVIREILGFEAPPAASAQLEETRLRRTPRLGAMTDDRAQHRQRDLVNRADAHACHHQIEKHIHAGAHLGDAIQRARAQRRGCRTHADHGARVAGGAQALRRYRFFAAGIVNQPE